LDRAIWSHVGAGIVNEARKHVSFSSAPEGPGAYVLLGRELLCLDIFTEIERPGRLAIADMETL